MATLRRLADGHTMVLRPYAHASLAVSHLAWLVEEAGFPAGVVNVVPTTEWFATGSPRVVADVRDFSQPAQVLVHRDGYDSAVAALVALAGEQVVGDPLDPVTTVGPLRSAGERDQVLAYLADAHVVTGGRPLDRPGYFIEPTVVVGCTGALAGPIVVVTPVGS
jgi:acyl-CoA reductase-like NAD-dependent aldehyde dehydrogenase